MEEKEKTNNIPEKENKNLHLSERDLKYKEFQLGEEKNKKEACEKQLKYLEDEDVLRMQKLQSELSLLQLKQQVKNLPQMEEDFKNEKWKEQINLSKKNLKNQLDTAEMNIKTLKRQINTKMA